MIDKNLENGCSSKMNNKNLKRRNKVYLNQKKRVLVQNQNLKIKAK